MPPLPVTGVNDPAWFCVRLVEAAACVAALAAESYNGAAAARQATEQALNFLEKAFARGYGRDQAATDPDLKAVSQNPHFTELIHRFANR